MTATATVPEMDVDDGLVGARTMLWSAPETPPAAVPEDSARSWTNFWMWLVTPHIEFGAIYIGMIVVLLLDMSLVQALLGIVLGTAAGAISHGVLTARGIRLQVPPIVLSRLSFGYRGGLIPTTVMAVVSGLGWFVVNSVVGALALNALFGLPFLGALAIVVAVQAALDLTGADFKSIQRYLYPVITVLVIVAGILLFVDADPAKAPGSPWNLNGLIAIVVVACMAWAYTIGWNPYATDYRRYTPATSPRAAGIWAATGLFVATTFLMSVGVASALVIGTASDNPTDDFTAPLPRWLGILVLCGFLVGAVCGNAITLRSARRVFTGRVLELSAQTLGRLTAVAMTAVAFLLGWAASTGFAANYEGFIMVLGYWIGPWLNVTLVDQYLRRRTDVTPLLYDRTLSNKWGLFAVAFALVGSVCIYALQIVDDGRMPHGGLSYACLGMLVGFYLSGLIYGIGLKRMLKKHPPAESAEQH